MFVRLCCYFLFSLELFFATVCGLRKWAYFGAVLSGTKFYLFVFGIQNIKEDQNKVTMLRIPQKIWLWPIAESAFKSQIAQIGLVMGIKFSLLLLYI